MKKQTETDLIRAALELLKLHGCFAFRVNTTGVRRTVKDGRQFWTFSGMRGVSDILGCVGPKGTPGAGKFLAVETKVGKNRLSLDQLTFQAAVLDANGLYFEVRSLKDLEELLEENGI